MVAVPVRRVRPKAPTRQRGSLTDQEQQAFASLCGRRLYADAKPVWDFWRAVAEARDLDHKSIIGNPNDPMKFTALPLGHGKHWCWPSSLNLPPPPALGNVAFT